VEERCIAADVPVAPAYSARDIALDPHFAARRDLVEIDDPVLGPLRQQAPYPRLVGEPAPQPAGAPVLGAHNKEVWGDLVGVDATELEDLRVRGIV
jgi:formyl-CoA transferase